MERRVVTSMGDNCIQIMEKPEYITYKDISDVLKKAHEQHREKGINMRVPSLPPDELQKWVGEEGKCYVAMLNGKLVGTSSIVFRTLDRWFSKGNVAELTMMGVLPEYQGMHIATMLNEALEKEIVCRGFSSIYSDTAEENTSRIKMCEKEGYILVDYLFPNANSKGHFFVGMMKWLDGCPFSKNYCAFHFKLKRFVVRFIYSLLGDKLYRLRKLLKN